MVDSPNFVKLETSNRILWFYWIMLLLLALVIFTAVLLGSSKSSREIFLGLLFILPLLFIGFIIFTLIAFAKFKKLKVEYNFYENGVEVLKFTAKNVDKFLINQMPMGSLQNTARELSKEDVIFTGKGQFLKYDEIEKLSYYKSPANYIDKMFGICHLSIKLKSGKRIRFSNLSVQGVKNVLETFKLNKLLAD